MLDAGEQTQALGAGMVVAVPAPVALLLPSGHRPERLERALHAAHLALVRQVRDERDRGQPIHRPVRDVRTDPGFCLREIFRREPPAELFVPLPNLRHLVTQAGEEAVDEVHGVQGGLYGGRAEATLQVVHPLQHQRIIPVQPPDVLLRTPEPPEAIQKLGDGPLRDLRGKTGYVDLPPFPLTGRQNAPCTLETRHID